MTLGTIRSRSMGTALFVLAAGLVFAAVAPAHAAEHRTVTTVSASAQASADEVTYYEVRAASDGEPEFLFEIAQRYLGNGNRFTEIFELNQGRPQPGGGALTDPTALQPGWILIMPDDAAGEGIEVGPLPSLPEEPAPGGSAEPTADPTRSAPGESLPEESAAGGRQEEAAESGGSGLPVVAWVLIAVVAVAALALGVMVFVRRARRRSEQPFDDSLLRTDTSASWTVDRALRVLLSASARDGIAVPGVIGVYIEGSGLRLRLAAPHSPAPKPWIASEDGLSWAAPITQLQRESVGDDSTEQFARLVTLGDSESGRVLVDFARARGVISLDGPTAIKHEVLRGWLGELTGNPWSDHPRVVMIGNGLPQPEAAEHLATLEQLLPELETESRGVLVLSQRPSPTQQSTLAARFASPRFGWTVIVLDDMAGARWRLRVDGDRWLRSDFLPDVRLPARPVSHRKTD